MRLDFIIIHHSWTEDGLSIDSSAIKRYHKNLGWSDVGYHYLVELVNGEYVIIKGRMDNEVGAHCKGFNDRSLGICFVGNFDDESPSMQLLEVATRLIKSLNEIYDIPINNVLGHRETYELLNKPVEKTCPGKKFDMDKLRSLL